MRIGDIDAAQEDPVDRARIVSWASGERTEKVIDSVQGSWKSYYRNISAALDDGAELVVKPAQILRLMQVYDAAMQSSETGKTIILNI